MLADFRAWLCDLAAGAVPEPAESREEPLDLHTLLGQFTALRHEVNLQTKAVRAQQEQNAETLQQLGAAVESLREWDSTEDAAGAALRPILKALIETADALALARSEVERLDQTTRSALDDVRGPAASQRTLWRRWFGPAKETAAQQAAGTASDHAGKLLDSVRAGYRMSLQRLERALQQQGLETISCIGEPFDPECMEVMEAVADSARPAGEVVGVVRPGYRLNGKVFRYAQVRVAR